MSISSNWSSDVVADSNWSLGHGVDRVVGALDQRLTVYHGSHTEVAAWPGGGGRTSLHLPGLRVDGGLVHRGPPVLRLYINLTVVINAVQLHRVGVHHGAVVLTDVSPQVVFPVISAVTHWTGPDFGLRVLRIDVPLQTLLIVKRFVTMNTLMIS